MGFPVVPSSSQRGSDWVGGRNEGRESGLERGKTPGTDPEPVFLCVWRGRSMEGCTHTCGVWCWVYVTHPCMH